MIPNREREDKTINKKSTFIRDKSNFQNQRQYSRENLQSNEHSDIVQLPGQIDTNSPVDQPKSRNYANQRIMNVCLITKCYFTKCKKNHQMLFSFE